MDIVVNVRAIEKEEEGEDTQQAEAKVEARAEDAIHSDVNLKPEHWKSLALRVCIHHCCNKYM